MAILFYGKICTLLRWSSVYIHYMSLLKIFLHLPFYTNMFARMSCRASEFKYNNGRYYLCNFTTIPNSITYYNCLLEAPKYQIYCVPPFMSRSIYRETPWQQWELEDKAESRVEGGQAMKVAFGLWRMVKIKNKVRFSPLYFSHGSCLTPKLFLAHYTPLNYH
jgi:hypothetical protein